MDIVVYGFNGFDPWALNPSELIVKQLASDSGLASDVTLHTVTLPTEYVGLERPLEQMLRQVRPQIVLGLGLTSLRDLLCLETFAVNADDSELPDNTNLIRQVHTIQTDGPAALRTTADLMPIAKRLHQLQLPAEISFHAGTYICNHSYYRVLHLIEQEQLAVRCVFLHLPMIEAGELADMPMQRHWQLAELRLAVDTVLEELIAQQRG